MEEKENFKDKMDKKIGVLITYTDTGASLVSMPCSKFPIEFWREWEDDCKKRFNGIRWMKIWHDHETVKRFNLEIECEMLKSALAEKQKEAEEHVEHNPLGLLNGGD